MTLNTTTHKNILIKILKDIYTDSTIGPILGFKGGTAVYLFYNLNRFSVDLDFDLLDAEKEDYVFEQVKKILENYGTIKEAEKKRFNLFYVMAYDDKVPGAQNIKVEINRREFGSKYEVKSYLGISMKVMVREDMFAHKLCAMYERIGKTNRDIFDVWYFLQNEWPVNKEIVESRTGMKFKEFLQKCIDSLEKITDQNILSGMGELLDNKQKDWVKAKLRTETIFLLKLALDNEK
ncbi:MAG: nucleotidyl transferase AbiEii/AbiGii toxin family protein [Candidatus Gastranaerophilales bacterium]|jgi:predicted nucleotidyltransferase component of viral defense system|nr:nucleotidyl transferase AbiEii/AbiGii toxin family protein [Candidatus Gastranaerophilales bacterium]